MTLQERLDTTQKELQRAVGQIDFYQSEVNKLTTHGRQLEGRINLIKELIAEAALAALAEGAKKNENPT